MARTFVQQSQISGSLSFNDTLSAGEALAGKQTLGGDLDALRSQLNKIIGKTNWFDALDGTQDLADIYAAVHMNGTEATFQGDITGSAGLDLKGAAHLESTLLVDGVATFGSDANVMGNADVDGTLIVGGVADFSADVYAATNVGVSGSLDVAGAASLGSTLSVDGVTDFAADVFMAASLGVSGTLDVAQKASFAGIVDVATTLSASEIKIDGDVVGHLYLVGADGEIQDSDKLFFDGSMMQVTGSVDISAGLNVASGGLTVAGDRLEVTGSFGLLGDAALDGALSVAGVADFDSAVYMASDLGVSGSLAVAGAATLAGGLTVNNSVADFNAGITANEIKIDGDVATRLYIVGDDLALKDEAKLTFDGSLLLVTGSLETTSDARVGGDLTVVGNDILDGSDEIVLSFKSINSVADSVEVAHNMEVKGDMFYAVSGSFSGDLTVQGDLTIQGSMTYIDTENLKVKDTLIHLNVGGNSNLSPRGIVLHGDQAYDDLAFGAKPASGDFIFAKEVSDADVDAGNSDVFAAAKLASAWMGEVKLGGVEGSLSGSLSATPAGAELSSTADLSIASADDLLLSANGETAISFIATTEQPVFATNFPDMTLIGAVNELFNMIGGGSAAKGDLSSANVSGGVLTFSSIGTLTAAEHKLVDIYLNGVLLSPSRDLSSLTTTTVALDSAIASALMVDDVITVVIRSAA